VCTLADVADVERGKFSARPRNDQKYFDGGHIPFIQTGDIANSRRFIKTSSQFINDAGLGVSRLFPKDTIFLTIAANIGDVAICSIPMACPDSVVGISPKLEQCDTQWLYYLLKYSKEYFDGCATQNAQKNINLQVLRPYTFALPPLKEQQKIAAILTTMDDKLDVIARQIAASQSLKQGLMQSLFSRGVGTRNSEGRWLPHSEFNDSELGEIPSDWQVKAIGEVLEIIERPIKMKDDQLYRRVTVKRRHGGVELRDELPGRDIKVKNQFLLEAGDFLISERQIVHGACGLVPMALQGALVSNEYLVLKAREGFDAVYFNHLVRLLKYAKLFMLCSQGVDIEKFLFKPKDWLKKKIPIPPHSEQQRIAETLSAIEAKTKALLSKEAEYQKIKRGLMQKLLNGEWRVKIDSPAPSL
jgi:type I restriction enzyme S subunit